MTALDYLTGTVTRADVVEAFRAYEAAFMAPGSATYRLQQAENGDLLLDWWWKGKPQPSFLYRQEKGEGRWLEPWTTDDWDTDPFAVSQEVDLWV